MVFFSETMEAPTPSRMYGCRPQNRRPTTCPAPALGYPGTQFVLVQYLTTYGSMVHVGFRVARRISRLLAKRVADEHLAIEREDSGALEGCRRRCRS